MRYIKLFEGYINEGTRKVWKLRGEMISKINSEINNVLIELTDNGFEIEINHFAKKIVEQNSILVSIHKNNEVFNSDEVKDNIEVLLAYIDENYGVKEYGYYIEKKVIEKKVPETLSLNDPLYLDSEYPDNLEIIEIDIDITI